MRLFIMMMRKTTAAVSLVKTMGFLLCILVISASSPLVASADEPPNGKGLQNETILNPTQSGQSIPWSGLGAKATEQAGGKGLSITPTDKGAKLECALQRLEGEVTPAGFTLTSTAKDDSGQFTLKASGMGRGKSLPQALAETGRITVDPGMVRRVRPNVVEEYSVSADGIRQDFMILSRPEGQGPLFLQLDLSGATAAASDEGATLTLAGSGRKLAYGKLHVMDAKGRDLPARFRAAGTGASKIGIEVDDANAAYPIRIDPTITDDDWVSMNPEIQGPNGDVKAIVIHGSDMYIGGSFTIAGRVMAKNIAKWDGANWSALGSGIDGAVSALAADREGNLYAAGDFTSAGGVSTHSIARWDGTNWSALGNVLGWGPDIGVKALAVDGMGNLYAGGNFETVGGVSANSIAKWDGSGWSALGSGMGQDGSSREVNALAVDDAGNLYAGGDFSTVGGVSANGIAKWDGTNWSALGSGMYGRVYALVVDGAGNLYAGGSFTTAEEAMVSNIAKWDGANWIALGSGIPDGYGVDRNQMVLALAVDGAGNLYAGGSFLISGDIEARSIAKWDGTSWSALKPRMGKKHYIQRVDALAVDGAGNLYAAANICDARDVFLPLNILYIAKWDGADWSALGTGSLPGIGQQRYALAADGKNLYVGGCFPSFGGVTAKCIAKWGGTSWSALGSGMDADYSPAVIDPVVGFTCPAVYALAADGKGNLYAGGHFETADGVAAKNIAKWNGAGWSALGSGMDFDVFALAADGAGNLYAGGGISWGDTVTITNITKWDGAKWSVLGSVLGSGMDPHYPPAVIALAADSAGNLYAGGWFETVGGVSANNIARWDGARWNALGSGIGQNGSYESVSALAVDGEGNLYAGGYFTIAGGVAVKNIAKWNGVGWSALGSGIDQDGSQEDVKALVVDDEGNLYAGGPFTTAGGVAAKNIAKWDGIGWSALGSGMDSIHSDSEVNAIVVDDAGNLYAGGDFETAGNKISPYIAKCLIPYEESKKSGGGGGGCFVDVLMW